MCFTLKHIYPSPQNDETRSCEIELEFTVPFSPELSGICQATYLDFPVQEILTGWLTFASKIVDITK